MKHILITYKGNNHDTKDRDNDKDEYDNDTDHN